MTAPLPRPDTSADFYLLAILDELRAILDKLAPEPAPAPEPAKRATRKPS